MSNLKRTAIWITMLALVLKLSGFLRESIIAYEFGVSKYTDGYNIAFSFITLALAMISGGFNNVFLPLYTKFKINNPAAAEKNANGIMNITFLLFLAVTITGFFFVPVFVPLIFPVMTKEVEVVAIEITRIFFLFLSFIALNGILDSFLQGRKVFVPSQISKLLATLMGAIFALLFSDIWGINSLAYGFVVGTLLGIGIQFTYLLKTGYRWSPTLKVETDFRKTFLVLLVPSLLNSVVGQINMFVNKIFASSIGDGPVTYLNDASLLVSIPHTIYGTTIAVIIFTLLADQVQDQKKFQDTFFRGIELSLVTLLPISVGLFLVGDAAISFIFERGKFTAEDTYNTYIALIFYVPMIVTQGLQYIVSKSMYAREKTAIVMRISVTTIALNALLNWVFLGPFGYPGLALTSSFVSVYYLVVTTIFVYKDFERGEVHRLWNLIIRVIPATILMALPVYFLKEFTGVGELYSLFQLAILVPIGAVLYVGGTYVFYRQGFNRLIGILRKKAVS